MELVLIGIGSAFLLGIGVSSLISGQKSGNQAMSTIGVLAILSSVVGIVGFFKNLS